MSWTYVGGAASGNPATSSTIDLSAVSWANGDLAVLFVGADNDNQPHVASGWTSHSGLFTGSGTDRGTSLWSRYLRSGDSNTVAFSAPVNCYGVIAVYREALEDLACAAAVYSDSFIGDNVVAPAITATSAGLHVVGYHVRATPTDMVAPSGYSTRQVRITTSTSVALGDKPVSAGSVTTTGWTIGVGQAGTTAVSIVFQFGVPGFLFRHLGSRLSSSRLASNLTLPNVG